MKEGDFVRVDYVGIIKESGLVFEVTNAQEAKNRGLFNPQNTYYPLPVIIGAKFVIQGLEDAIKSMKVGDKKEVKVKSEEGFGKREPKLIKMFTEAEFHKNNIVPYQGMPVNIGNMMGRVLSTSGGRVKVDFNHPLSGKDLIYDLEVKEAITKREDKVGAILEFYFGRNLKWDISMQEKSAEIVSMAFRDTNPRLKEIVSQAMLKWVPGVETVRFVDEYKKPQEESKKPPTEIKKNPIENKKNSPPQ